MGSTCSLVPVPRTPSHGHASRTRVPAPTSDCDPPAKRGRTLSWSLAAVAAQACTHTLAAVAAHAPAHPRASDRGHHPASPGDRLSSEPAAAPCLKRPRLRAADGCLASTRSTDRRRTHACRCGGSRVCMRAGLSAVAEQSSGVARHNPPTAPPSVGPTRPKPGAPGPTARGRRRMGVCRNPRLAALRGAGSMGYRWATSCRCGGTTRLPLWRHAAPGMSPLTPLAAPSHAVARHEGSNSRCHRRQRSRTW